MNTERKTDFANLATPVLSIIIPTKNRAHTATECADLALKVGGREEVEVVIQDCSENDFLGTQLLQDNLLGRVSYERTQPVSMVDNWNRAVSRATGEYILIIGDDDAVYPSALKVAKWANNNKILAVKQKFFDEFWWPEFYDPSLASKFKSKSNHSGLAVMEKTLPLLKRHSSVGDSYSIFPMAYHNLLHRSIFELLLKQTGCYFDSLCPDVYSGYAIGALIDEYILLDLSFTVVGASALSNSQRLKVGHSEVHFSEFNGYRHSSLVPDTYGLYAAMGDSMVKAFENLERSDLLEHVDFSKIYARTIVAEPSSWYRYFRRFNEANRALGKPVAKENCMLIAKIAGKFLKKSIQKHIKASPEKSGGYQWTHTETIAEAVRFKSELLGGTEIKLAE